MGYLVASSAKYKKNFKRLLICNSEQQRDFQSTFNYIYERLLAMHFYIFLYSFTATGRQFLFGIVPTSKVHSSSVANRLAMNSADFLITFTCPTHRIRHMCIIWRNVKVNPYKR